MIDTNKLQGALIGLAVGDAVGTTLEFTPHGDYGLTDMVGGGPFYLPVGAWTDDTSMALCLAESLLAKGTFDAQDQIARYARWASQGENSSTGHCFDIGGTVRAALTWHARNPGARFVPPSDDEGNGSLMRLAPIPMHFWRDPTAAGVHAMTMSRTTHGGIDAARICAIYSRMILAATEEGATKESVLECGAMHASGLVFDQPDSSLATIFVGRSYATKPRSAIRGSGYVVQSVEAALWAFWSTDSFEAAVLAAANLGQDTDTTAAIVGQLAGAFYGVDGIPATWRAKLVQGDRIAALAAQLVA